MGKNAVIQAAVVDWGFQPSRSWDPILAANEQDVGPTESFFRWHPSATESARLEYIERREGLTLEEERPVDVAAIPGINLTMEVLSREADRRMLKSLVERIYRAPLSWGIEEPTSISEDTMLTALAFIELLPPEVPVPRMAPDGEGGLTMRWDTVDHRTHLLGIEGWRLHFVFNAGRGEARYLDDVKFTGDEIPDEIRALLA